MSRTRTRRRSFCELGRVGPSIMSVDDNRPVVATCRPHEYWAAECAIGFVGQVNVLLQALHAGACWRPVGLKLATLASVGAGLDISRR